MARGVFACHGGIAVGKIYKYRTTEPKLEAAYQRVESSGDTVEHVVYKGGHQHEYLLICREDPAVAASRDGRSGG